jgi:hypothetical protein
MPKVPTRQQPEVQTTAFDPGPARPQFQNIRSGPDDFGAGIGRGAQQLGGALGRVAVQLENESNKEQERLAKQADLDFAARIQAAGFGDGTQQNPGVYGTRGELAISAAPAATATLEAARAEILESLPTQAAKDVFSLSSQSRLLRETEQFGRHVNGERRRAQEQASIAREEEARDYASDHFRDDIAVTQSITQAFNEAVTRGRDAGLPPEAVRNTGEEARTAVVRQTIIAALQGQDVARAQELFKKFSPIIDGREKPAIERMLTQATEVVEAQGVADEAMKAAATEKEAEKLIKASSTGTKREQALRIMRNGFAVNRRAEKQAKESAKNDLAAFLTNREGGKRQTIRDYALQKPAEYDLIRNDAELWENAQKLERMAAENREFSNVPNNELYGELIVQSAQQPREFADLDLSTIKARVSKDQFDKLQSAQRGAATRVTKAQSSTAIYTQADRLVSANLTKEFKTKRNDGKRDFVAADAAIRSSEHVADTGKTPSPKEVRDEVLRLVTPLAIDPTNTGFLGLPQKGEEAVSAPNNFVANLAGLSPKQRASARIPVDNIPPADRQKIEAAILASGQKVTDDLTGLIAAAAAMNDRERVTRLLSPKKK